ncbi:MAG: transglutaminase-like domain-containing protein [Gemmatimonadaceae bacterium]
MPVLNTRTIAAGSVLLAWSVGIVVFAKKERTRTARDRMAEMSLRVAPGAQYYAAERGGAHVGFSSSTIDTLARTLQLTEYQVADTPTPAGIRRVSQQSVIRLTRGLALREFAVSWNQDSTTRRLSGSLIDDSTMTLKRLSSDAAPDSQTLRVPTGVLLPSLIPVVVALGAGPLRVGFTQSLSLFDPETRRVIAASVAVLAESTFVLADSAVFDASRGKWSVAHADTVRGWRLHVPELSGPDRWVDASGAPAAWTSRDSLTFRRTAYEIAFENWRLVRPRERAANDRRRGNVESVTAVQADATTDTHAPPRRRVTLSGVALATFDLAGYGQTQSGDTVTVDVIPSARLMPSFPLPPDGSVRQRYASSLGSSPFIESDAPAIVTAARRIAGRDSDPAQVTRRLLQWMQDSISRGPTRGTPSALQLLRERHGDAAAHAELLTAMGRALGLPVRSVAGVLLIGSRVYPHAWAEVFLQGWVPVDPVFNEFPASPNHVRLLVDGAPAFDDFQRAVSGLRVARLPDQP